MRRFGLFLLAAAVLLFTPFVRATIFGNIRGIVHDPQHRPIAGAEVKLHSATSDWLQVKQTDSEGQFAFTAVPLGDYVVTVSLTGFATAEQRITLAAESSPVIHIQLKISAVKETATVSAQADEAIPTTDSVTPATLVDRQDIRTTPGADLTNSLKMITDYVPGAYYTHDQLHIRGGHQVTWMIDGVPIPNTNIASNLGPQIDPKDIDYLDVQRGSYGAAYGDRTYGIFDVVPRSGFEKNNEAELVTTLGNWYQTNDQLNFGSHTQRFAYYASVNGNRSNMGLQTPIGQVFHDAENGYGGFGSFLFNVNSQNQLRLVTSLRQDYYQVPYDPNPNAAFDSSGLRDGQHETDGYVIFSWVRTLDANTFLTVSPFYHHNSANYDGAPADTPQSTTDHQASDYGGLQSTLNVSFARNNIQAGIFGFGQRYTESFGLIFNPLNQCPVTPSNPAGNCQNISPPERESASGGVVAGFVEDKFKPASWLTLIAGMRPTHFSGQFSEDTINPRFGVAAQVPHLNWVFRAFYGHYYQPPPLTTVAGPLLQQIQNSGQLSFVPLHGERDEEHQFGVTIPFRGWVVDADTFQTRANNFFDHNNVGESNIFIPVTIDGALIRGWELTLRSPRLWSRGQFHLAYSNQVAQARGAITGGLICFPPTDPACQPARGYSPLDHDQRNTLNVGFDANLPWRVYASSNVYYGSGFPNGSPTAQFPGSHLPQHTTFDFSLGKSFGEKYSVALTALNVSNRHLLIDNSLTFGGFHYNDPREIYVEFRWRFHY
ncbi:MAG TPA: TonB-dependent receptor [Candidatus Limnocylindria bacterium]|nr:TonB-dependent receptor [Candidatus Limnocylindria bacterium]